MSGIGGPGRSGGMFWLWGAAAGRSPTAGSSPGIQSACCEPLGRCCARRLDSHHSHSTRPSLTPERPQREGHPGFPKAPKGAKEPSEEGEISRPRHIRPFLTARSEERQRPRPESPPRRSKRSPSPRTYFSSLCRQKEEGTTVRLDMVYSFSTSRSRSSIWIPLHNAIWGAVLLVC